MTKFRTRLFSAVVAVAIAVTLALPASAYGKGGDEIHKQYTLGTKVAGTAGNDRDATPVYNFRVSKQMSVVLNLKSAGDAVVVIENRNAPDDDVNHGLILPTKIDTVKADKVTTTHYDGGEINIEIAGGATAEVNLTYSLAPGEYGLLLPVYKDKGGQAFEFSIAEVGTTPVAPQPFQRGSVVSNVKADRTRIHANYSEFNITWSEVPTAEQYIVYYIARDNETGAFGNWYVQGVGRASLQDVTIDKEHTLYVTILPLTDTPSRQYGGFSTYTLVEA